MDPQTATLSQTIFGPQSSAGDARNKSQAGGIVEQLLIYHWPKNMGLSGDAKLTVLAYMTSYGRSDDASPSRWGTLMYSYLVLAFEEFQGCIERQNHREYVFKPLPAEFIEAVLALANAAEVYEEPEAYNAVVASVPAMEKFPHIPINDTYFPGELAATLTIPAVYGYAALIVFLAGKRINEKNKVTIITRRPKNLKDAHQITDEAAFYLDGDGKMSDAAHMHFHQAWISHYHARVAVISEIARFGALDTTAQRVVFTLSKMLQFAGMQQATFIHRFLQAFPHCINYACIRPSYNAYVASLHEVASAPQHLQPYYKVLYAEGTRAFHRTSILNLSACATVYERHTQSSMDNFDLGEGATPAVAMYDAEAAARGHPTLQNLTFADGNESEAE